VDKAEELYRQKHAKRQRGAQVDTAPLTKPVPKEFGETERIIL